MESSLPGRKPGVPVGRDGLRCPMCEAATLIRRHCKTLCERCGYVESCEDSFVPNQAAPEAGHP